MTPTTTTSKTRWTGRVLSALAILFLLFDSTHTLFPIYVAALIWRGLFLQEGRLRALVPLRR